MNQGPLPVPPAGFAERAAIMLPVLASRSLIFNG
jgi:hypothetical protein